MFQGLASEVDDSMQHLHMRDDDMDQTDVRVAMIGRLSRLKKSISELRIAGFCLLLIG